MAKRLAVVKLKMFFSLLSKIKAEAHIDTLANRLTDVEIKTLGETVSNMTNKKPPGVLHSTIKKMTSINFPKDVRPLLRFRQSATKLLRHCI